MSNLRTSYIILAAALSIFAVSCKEQSSAAEADNFVITIKNTAQNGTTISVTASYLRLGGKGSVTETGIKYRRADNAVWTTAKSQSVATPFSVAFTNADYATEYRIAAYAIVAGNTFISDEETFTTADNTDPTPDPTKVSWRELPTVTINDSVRFITHFTPLGSKTVRNYSLLYDHYNKVARWVAYPLHKAYMGDSGRTEAWAFDNIIPEENQIDMSSAGFTDANGYSTYDRGHQIPSADRTVSYAMNAPTFYYTNMTPQQSTLNQNLWANIETFARRNVCSDTLYIVTGCAVTTSDSTSILYATPRNGGRIAVPKYYFKVMMRTSSGSTGALPTDANAICIGFWIANKVPYSNSLSNSMAVSVAEIERLTGYTFFPTLSEKTKSALDTSKWSWK